ncbi:MAG: hypothetical protein M3312_10315 [Actinomycetota bacterium]|nr:hypothetical protein [Actinomycetota bacterium]
MSSREERVGQDGTTSREVNERLKARIADISLPGDLIPFLCECADVRCRQPVRLTLAEYDAVARNTARFVLVPGHGTPFEEVLERHDRSDVVEKTAREAPDVSVESDAL